MMYIDGVARTYSLEEIINTPGMYFNPQTEVMIVVDDSAELDAGWVMVSDETPIDEQTRDELLQDFQTHYHAGDARSLTATANELEEEGDDEEDDQEVGRDD
jgi:hypothetical protein